MSALRKRPPATIATNANSSGRRASSSISLRMFWTVLKPTRGRNRPNASRPASAASLRAATGSMPLGEGASAVISSHLLDFRPAEDALGQEDQRDGEDREG